MANTSVYFVFYLVNFLYFFFLCSIALSLLPACNLLVFFAFDAVEVSVIKLCNFSPFVFLLP